MIGFTLDSGALIALERGDERMRELVARAFALGQEVRVPTAVIAQVWRDPARQARLAKFVEDPHVRHIPMDLLMAKTVGLLCRASGTADVVDAAVAVCARVHSDYVITSDPEDMRRLVDPARVLPI